MCIRDSVKALGYNALNTENLRTVKRFDIAFNTIPRLIFDRELLMLSLIHISLQLNKLGHEVMAVDINEERVNESLTIVTNAQIGDSTNTCLLYTSRCV